MCYTTTTHSKTKAGSCFALFLYSQAKLLVIIVSLTGYLPSARKTYSILAGSLVTTIFSEPVGEMVNIFGSIQL